MKWYTIRLPVVIFIMVLVLVVVLLAADDFSMYQKRILWTGSELRRARSSVKWFKEETNRIPGSLKEINQYAKENSDSEFRRSLRFREYFSTSKGNSDEVDKLNGDGGWYYNKTTEEVRINITKPVRHYLKFYFGEERNQIPADW